MSHAHNPSFLAHHLWGVVYASLHQAAVGVVLLLVNNDYQQLGSDLFSGGPYVLLGCNRWKHVLSPFSVCPNGVMDCDKAVHW